jgi:hypothetical protein
MLRYSSKTTSWLTVSDSELSLIIDKYYAYHENRFYIASSKEIKIFIWQESDFAEGGSMEFNPRSHIEDPKVKGPVASISNLNNFTIHGLYSKSREDDFIFVAFETNDRQIDFNKLEVKQMPSIDEPLRF